MLAQLGLTDWDMQEGLGVAVPLGQAIVNGLELRNNTLILVDQMAAMLTGLLELLVMSSLVSRSSSRINMCIRNLK
jgi:hypothetical protein